MAPAGMTRTQGAEATRYPDPGIDPWPSLPLLADDLATDAGRGPDDDERQARLRVEQRRL